MHAHYLEQNHPNPVAMMYKSVWCLQRCGLFINFSTGDDYIFLSYAGNKKLKLWSSACRHHRPHAAITRIYYQFRCMSSWPHQAFAFATFTKSSRAKLSWQIRTVVLHSSDRHNKYKTYRVYINNRRQHLLGHLVPLVCPAITPPTIATTLVWQNTVIHDYARLCASSIKWWQAMRLD